LLEGFHVPFCILGVFTDEKCGMYILEGLAKAFQFLVSSICFVMEIHTRACVAQSEEKRVLPSGVG